MQQIKKILFILILLISSLVSQVLAEGVSCYRSGGVTDNEDPELNQFYYHSDHLGSSSYITNLNGSIVQHVEYVPFGEVFIEERNNKWNTPYLFNGKEMDEETGLYYYGARYYNSRNSIFLSVDPLWEEKPNFSPYNYCSWNPVMRVDPSGAVDNPIYDKNGEFLGTDDKGLQGEAIIIDRKDFTQGMSHEEAMNKGSTLDNMSWDDAFKFANNGNFENFLDHYNNLPNRIDYSPDFVLTKEIADKHWQGKSGENLYVNQANIDLPGVTTKDFNSQGLHSKNFIWGLSNTGKVYGTLDMTLLNPKTGTVKLGYSNPNVSPDGRLVMDRYDFTYDGRMMRNFATWIGKPSGNGKAFNIHGYGVAKIPVKK